MRFTRFFALAGLIALTGVATPAVAQHGGKKQLDSISFVNEFPLAFVYEGIGRFRAKDYQGAIDQWEHYLTKAGKNADTASINWMIHQAVILAYPEALVYEALALVTKGDTVAAIQSLERFQDVAPAGADTANVRKLTEDLFFDAYPLARLYQGVAYYLANDFRSAIGSWQKFLSVGTSEKERGQVRELISMARERLAAETLARGTTH